MRTLLFFILFLFTSKILFAQAGTPDSTFGINGAVVTTFGEHAIGFAVATQVDGKVVVAGTVDGSTRNDFALTRYRTNGALDRTFGGTGKITTDFRGFEDEATAIAIQPDGKIIAAGESKSINDYDFGLARYNINGTLDNTFDHDGKVTTDFGGNQDIIYAIALQQDGKIVVAGQTHKIAGLTIRFALARYNSNGSLDASFGTGGRVATLIGSTCEPYAVAIQQDGEIVVAGSAYNGTNYDFALVRYNQNGTLDASFGNNGIVSTAIGNFDDAASSLAIQPDGKIIVAGNANLDGAFNDDFAAVRYNSNGTLDKTFGINGKVTTPVGAGSDYCNAIALQDDGKIVLAGQVIDQRRFSDIALLRYNANGTLDNSFGTNGITTTAIGLRSDDAYATTLEPDDKIVVAGDSYVTKTRVGFAVVRYKSSSQQFKHPPLPTISPEQ